MSAFKGILPAVVTPFDKDGRFVPAPFEKLLERLYGAGVDGVYVCGQTGEGLLQDVAQRKQVAEAAIRNSPSGKVVVVHIGAHTTAEAVELARHAARAGAHAISSLPPSGGYSFAEIRSYYEAIAAAAGLPLLVYYFPEVCPDINSVEQLMELCSIPNVIGLKFTDYDLYRLSVLKREGVVVFNGRDEVLAAGLLMGADGGIGSLYNLVPDLFVKLYAHARANRWTAASAVQQIINELLSLLLQFPLLPATKRMLRWSGVDCGDCLGPRRPLTADEETRLSSLLARSALGDRMAARCET